MPNFPVFSEAVHAQYNNMAKERLFVVDVNPDELYKHYLDSFPEGTNPIYIKNTEHDCSCCRNFIKNLGVVVNITNELEYKTVWDVADMPSPYREVALSMAQYVRQYPIKGIFVSKERQYGAATALQRVPAADAIIVKQWHHFSGEVHTQHYNKSPNSIIGAYATKVQVFERGLNELTITALNQVKDLIDANQLYRGETYLDMVNTFIVYKNRYSTLLGVKSNRYIWWYAAAPHAHIRNTAIGTLLIDLSEGVELEKAVKKFDAMVAPTNYKRSSALITPHMVEDALKTLKNLDLDTATERMFAKLSQISVNNVLWVNNETKDKMIGGLEKTLLAEAKKNVKTKTKADIEDISLTYFIKKVLPKAVSIELEVKNNHLNNLMSLTGPVHTDAGSLFKWNNNFAWSYTGNTTDSIKERVKAAGGNTNAALRFSLSWHNTDDLDIHVYTPVGNHIYYGNKMDCLDVDMNAGCGYTKEPVENVSFNKVTAGQYEVRVHQFSRRNTSDYGFTLQVEANGVITEYSYDKLIQDNGTNIEVGKFFVDAYGNLVDAHIPERIKQSSASRTKWGVTTNQFVKVNTILHSPNFWDNQEVGHKHTFFILDNCVSDEPIRGIYNEFLKSDLEKHRKVFEVIGNKTLCEPTQDQLSGLGFTAARNDTVIVKVDNRLYNITF